MRILKMFNYRLQQILAKFIAVLAMAMLFSIVAEIIGREIFSVNFDWVIELNRILFIWIVYLGAACGFSKMSHIRVELVIERLHGIPRKLLTTVIHLLNCLFFAIIAMYASDMMGIAKSNLFSTMPLSYMWIYLPALIFGLTSILFTVENLHKLWYDREAI